MSLRHLLAPTVMLLLLAACDSETEAVTAEQGGQATGEVLGGTISDDMIALERLTSQSPPAARQPGDGSSNGSQPSGAGSEDESAAPAEASPEPQDDADAAE